MQSVLKTVFIASCLTACAASSSEEAPQAGGCPLYETRDWTASVKRSVSGDQPYQLQIDGVVDAPDPTYRTTFRLGPLDRRQPPALIVFVDSKPSGDGAIQVIDPQPVSFRWNTALRTFRAIRVVCGERLLVEFSDVEASD